MPIILLRVEPPPLGTEGYFPTFDDDELEVTRIPCVGELVHVGEDEEGKSLDYRVVLVQHIPAEYGPRDAEVFAVRIDREKIEFEAYVRARKELGLPFDAYPVNDSNDE